MYKKYEAEMITKPDKTHTHTKKKCIMVDVVRKLNTLIIQFQYKRYGSQNVV